MKGIRDEVRASSTVFSSMMLAQDISLFESLSVFPFVRRGFGGPSCGEELTKNAPGLCGSGRRVTVRMPSACGRVAAWVDSSAGIC